MRYHRLRVRIAGDRLPTFTLPGNLGTPLSPRQAHGSRGLIRCRRFNTPAGPSARRRHTLYTSLPPPHHRRCLHRFHQRPPARHPTKPIPRMRHRNPRQPRGLRDLVIRRPEAQSRRHQIPLPRLTLPMLRQKLPQRPHPRLPIDDPRAVVPLTRLIFSSSAICYGDIPSSSRSRT